MVQNPAVVEAEVWCHMTVPRLIINLIDLLSLQYSAFFSSPNSSQNNNHHRAAIPLSAETRPINTPSRARHIPYLLYSVEFSPIVSWNCGRICCYSSPTASRSCSMYERFSAVRPASLEHEMPIPLGGDCDEMIRILSAVGLRSVRPRHRRPLPL